MLVLVEVLDEPEAVAVGVGSELVIVTPYNGNDDKNRHNKFRKNIQQQHRAPSHPQLRLEEPHQNTP